MRTIDYLLKENIISYLQKQNKNCIYISSSNKNLEYYHYSLLDGGFNSYYFDDIYLNDENKNEIINKIFDIINNEKEFYIFIQFNLSLNLMLKDILKLHFEINKEYNIKEIEKIVEKEYIKTYIIKNKNEYSIKNEKLEFFPLINDNPIRMTFFDNELESIKEFDVDTQKSINKLESFDLYINDNKKMGDFFVDYINNKKIKLNIYLENIDYLEIKAKEFDDINIETKNFITLRNNSKLLKVKTNKEYNYNIKRKYKNKSIKNIENYSDIEIGDYVIHLNYGIGIYQGVEIINNKEYILLKYADQDKLYIPIDNIDKLHKYYNQDDPTIYKLGTKNFKKKLKKLQENIDKFIDDLIEVQAKRSKNIGYIYSKDSKWQKEFENSFIYPLTDDQLKAISEIKNDMESNLSMDRLIVADAGFGKTEVAMRAIFKAVENGKQCLMLVPTTVLANQQFERFEKRFENFPIKIATLSRLLSNKDKTKNIEDLKNGKIDVLIGTHSALSKEIKFKNLGLLVIDEEQKFGVKQKEKLKIEYENIDILSLSATPIPRTLNMTMLGLKDISIIETPPSNRLPISTEIIDYDENNIRNIILKELSRDGQVFYITNNVKNMKEKTNELKSLLPDYVNIDFIHGKLSPFEIKEKIDRFERGEFEILVSSTIIESGIDIQNANTVIVEQFENLGLAQIYQIRGRVGRGTRKGYCFLIKKEFSTSKGKKKIESMKNIENLNNVGLNISMEDLRIRGAGELLGSKQSGIIENFGYDIYIKLLNESIKKKKLKNKYISFDEINIEIENKGFIPNEYIEMPEKLLIYKRLLNMVSYKEIEDMKNELFDRFGKIPVELYYFFDFISLRIFALNNNIKKIVQNGENFDIIKDINNEIFTINLSREEFNRRVKYEKNFNDNYSNNFI